MIRSSKILEEPSFPETEDLGRKKVSLWLQSPWLVILAQLVMVYIIMINRVDTDDDDLNHHDNLERDYTDDDDGWSGESDYWEARRSEEEERQGKDKENVDEAQETGNDAMTTLMTMLMKTLM